MSARARLQNKVADYLAERRQLGFELHSMGYALRSLASYADSSGHEGALTADLMTEWARLDKKQSHTPATVPDELRWCAPLPAGYVSLSH